MSPKPGLKFLFWFAWLDLTNHRRARRVTAVCLVTVLALVLFAVVTFGLALGYQKRRAEQRRLDPAAHCLWIGSPVRGNPFLQPDLDRLNSALRQKLPAQDSLRGCFPFNTIHDLLWTDGARPEVLRDIKGRTLAPGDPLLDGCTVLKGRRFQSDNESGVIVCKAMLDELHLKVDACPPRLRVRLGLRVDELPVIGVLDKPLPHQHLFLLTEAGVHELRTKNPDSLVSAIRTGPIPDKWSKWSNSENLPADVANFLQKENLRWIGKVRFGAGWVWRLESQGLTHPRLTRWQVYLEQIAAKLSPQPDQDAPGFARPDPINVVEEPQNAPVGHQLVGVYVERDEDLEPAADILEELGHEPERTVIDQLNRLRRSMTHALTMLGVLTLIVALLALGNLWAIQDLRAQQMVVEIGMLKAMGLDRQMLRRLALVQSGLIGLTGALLGLALAWVLGRAAATYWLDPDTGQPVTAFEVPPWLLLLTVLGSAAVCVWGFLLATHRARRDPPIRSLSQG